MSTSSLINGTYTSLEDFSALVDRFLIALLTEGADTAKGNLARLTVLLAPGEDDEVSLDSMVLESLLASEGSVPNVDLAQLSKALTRGAIDAELIKDLHAISADLSNARGRVARRLGER